MLAETPDGFPLAKPRQALEELARYALVQREQETHEFAPHRLVQATTRHHLRQQADSAATDTLAATLRWLDGAFAGNPHDVRDWPQLDPLLPHAVAVSQRADQAELVGDGQPTTRLMNEVGQLLRAKARNAEAEPLMRRAVEIFRGTLGAEHPNTRTVAENLRRLVEAMDG